MAFRDRGKKDFNAGILYIVVGGFFALWAGNYPMGSAVRMGPAYFPTVLGWMLAALGLIVFVRSFFLRGEEPHKTNWRPLTLILASVVVFGFLLERAGMIAASFVMMLICGFGGWDFRWKEQLANAAFMTAVNVGVFYYALALPFKLFPWS